MDADSGPSTREQPNKTIDNRGAHIGQQVVVYGNATFGLTSNTAGTDARPANPLAARLEDAYSRHEELTVAGEDTTQVDAEILELRRLQRQGPTLKAGEFLGNGRFRLVDVIGQGGFATVWKAYDRRERQPVAVKALHGQFAHDSSRRERLFRGARKMAALQHPNVVRVLVPEGEDQGFYYYVMEYVDGVNLYHAVVGGQLDTDRALVVIELIASALEAAHHCGLVHRDVKPQNILLHESGMPKLTDFDLVRARDTTGGTRTGAIGTVLFAAPEQNEDASRTDHRADVYSLGMTAVFCVHGKKLPHAAMFKRDAFLTQLACHDALRNVLLRAVALDPADRFESMESFRVALAMAMRSSRERLVSEPTVCAKGNSVSEGLGVHPGRPKLARTRPRMLMSGVAAGGLALSLWFVLEWLTKNHRSELKAEAEQGQVRASDEEPEGPGRTNSSEAEEHNADTNTLAVVDPARLAEVDALISLDRLGEALRLLTPMLDDFPRNAILMWREAQIYRKSKKVWNKPKALAAYRNVIIVQPSLLADHDFYEELNDLLSDPELRSQALDVALQRMGRAGHPFLLERINDAQAPLSFPDRRRALKELRTDPESFALINSQLQLGLDLLQAALQSSTPCTSYREALEAIATSRDYTYLAHLSHGPVPTANAGAYSINEQEADAVQCEGIEERRGEVMTMLQALVPDGSLEDEDTGTIE